jgi:hypothetical protein
LVKIGQKQHVVYLSAFMSLIFVIQTDRVLCEVLAEAEETFRVEADDAFDVNITF